MENLSKAILRIRPNAEFSIYKDKIIQWKGDDQPTQKEVDAVLIQIEKEGQTSKKHQSMIADIYAEMKNVFGTSSDESAQRMVAMYEAMVKRPKNYIDKELGFIDENSITIYANEKLLLADKYAIFVLKRIAEFEKEKILILE